MSASRPFISPVRTSAEASRATAFLFHRDPRTGCPIEQPLEMEACELIVGMLADVRCESRNCTGIGSLQLSERIQVTRCRRVFELLHPDWLEGTQRLSPTPQNEVADRPALKVLDLAASIALTQMRVPSCLLAASSRAATLMVSP